MNPGYWCECTAQHGTDATTFAASFTANSPHQAVRWIRIALRTISPALDPAAAEHVWQWPPSTSAKPGPTPPTE